MFRKILEIASKLPNLIGGSADLAGSNNTKTKIIKLFNLMIFPKLYPFWSKRTCDVVYYEWYFTNSELVTYGGTFLIFNDYCKPSIRLATYDEAKSYLCFYT